VQSYSEFLSSKAVRFEPVGFDPQQLCPMAMPFQRDITRWAVRKGRAALFEDCGLGKTEQQLDWSRSVHDFTAKPVLIFAPLAVSGQTVSEGVKFGIPVTHIRDASEIVDGINITNYERLHKFIGHEQEYGGIVLDESSILKGFDGKTRKALTEFASVIPYRLCCTATPAPNDYMELGNHAEFLGIMTLTEMLSMFFVHDGGDTSKWRLKRHAEQEFWKWVCSWAIAIRSPRDIGYDDDRFTLPPLTMEQVTVDCDSNLYGTLFPTEARTLDERRSARRASLAKRVQACADLVNSIRDPWIVWCDLNAESEALTAAIPDAIEVQGSHDADYKEKMLNGFARGEFRVLVSKPSIAGFGMNWQHCNRVAFVGLSDSYEQFYQAIRRCWRFGQTRQVHCYVITSAAEGAVVRNIERKEQQAMALMEGMVSHMKEEMQRDVRGTAPEKLKYQTDQISENGWTAILGDCIEEVSAMASESIDYSIFSPPFASLYTYSNSDRDMGNAKDYEEFSKHFDYLVPELFRVLRAGRLLSFHCFQIPLLKERDGVIGLRDFRGELIRIFERAGFIFHSEVCIWKDPVTAMQRTKAIGLLYKQLRKDSVLSRQGIPDYLVTMRKPGVNLMPVTKQSEDFPVELWQKYASPVWMDINPSKTLAREEARENEDERHICPLQLEVIERAIRLWTNADDLVLSPFMGIGSEGYEALKQGRRFIGVELKRSYWEQAVENLRYAATMANAQGDLFTESA
jgi:DNA modification methylase